jgi:predicted ATP-binding protein involved in virulence
MNNIKVKSLGIKNFKGIKNLELDFTYQENNKILNNIVIYGINGSGKSTILEAIYLCLIVASTYHKKADLRRIESYLIDYISLGSEWIYHNENEFTIDITLEDNEIPISGKLTYHQQDGLKWVIKDDKKLSSEFQNSFTYLSSYRLLNPSTVHSAGDWSEIERIEDDVSRNRMKYKRDPRYRYSNSFPSLSLQFENNYRTVKQYLVNLITDKKVEALTVENENILEKIKESFKIFFPNKEFLEKLSRTDNNKDYRLMIKNEDDSIVDLDQLSSGEREVIAFFTYLCTKAINNSILIIDEPELHLHSKWQSIILYSLHQIFPKSQIFLATHSNEIYQSSSESELFEVQKD